MEIINNTNDNMQNKKLMDAQVIKSRRIRIHVPRAQTN